MNKYSICVIGVYFGNLPKYFNLWLDSCKNNPDVDFLIAGDNKLYDLPNNVKCFNITLEEMKQRADKILGFDCVLDRPYKCCDYKVIYGLIFEDLLKGYDFWGHCDFDLIFGNIRKFINDEILDKYDKILDLGHLSLYRNTNENNNRYKLSGSECGDYVRAYTNKEIAVFDEKKGIYLIYKKNNFPVYDKKVYADIASVRKRFILCGRNDNYKNQVFYMFDGCAYRTYYKRKKSSTEEFLYIHFKKRRFDATLDSNITSYFICPKGFIEKKSVGAPTMREIKEINPYVLSQEIYDMIKQFCKFLKTKKRGLIRRLKVVLNKENKK